MTSQTPHEPKKWAATELHAQVSSKLMELIGKLCSVDALDSNA